MSLCEHLDGENWEDNLELFVETTLKVKLNTPHAPTGGAVSDVWACLRNGGFARLKEHLSEAAMNRRYPDAKRAALLKKVDDLGEKYQSELKELQKLHDITDKIEIEIEIE